MITIWHYGRAWLWLLRIAVGRGSWSSSSGDAAKDVYQHRNCFSEPPRLQTGCNMLPSGVD